MNAWSLIDNLLLAQIHRFDGLRDRFSGPRSQFGMDDAMTAILAVTAIGVLLFFVNRWHNRHSGRQSYNSPNAMFRELCKAHKLDRKTRQLLKRVARWQRLTQPARLFLEPERFEPANLSPELERHSAELFELRSKLFTFAVEPESRDTIMQDLAGAGAARGEMPVPMGTAAKPPVARTEAIGAAAFATTKLENTTGTVEQDA